ARGNRQQLLKLATAIQRYPLRSSSAKYDALLDYHRRSLAHETLLEKVVATISGTLEAELLLQTLKMSVSKDPASSAMPAESGNSPATTESRSSDEPKQIEGGAGPRTLGMLSLLMTGDFARIRSAWGAFLAEIAQQPLLYVPLARGGDATKI